MASITSLTSSSSSTSSLYGNRNIISGLASGMDTEAMIENSVSGYKTKISSLQQQMTKLQWKQDAYRSLISKMSSMLNKYTSYTSKTNLLSASFFSSAVKTIANGANASKVSATGKSSSNVALNAVKQMATAASYTVGTKNLAQNGSSTTAIDWDSEDAVKTSAVTGSISIEYGGGAQKSGSTFTLRFGADEVYEDAQALADAINEKLKEQNVTGSKGTSSADNYLEASVDADGKVVLADKKGNNFRISGTSGAMADFFEKTDERSGITVSKESFDGQLVSTQGTADYLKDQSINVTLDGKTKKISLDFAEDITDSKEFAEKLQAKLNDEFGKGKITVGEKDGALTFTPNTGDGATLKVAGSTTVNKALGLGDDGYSNTLQTSWTLDKALGSGFNWEEDEDGNKTATLTINGKDLTFKSTDTIQNVMDKINNDKEAGVDIKYSSLTGRFSLTAKETGADSRIDIGGDVGEALFGVSEEKARNANFSDTYDMELWWKGSETVTLNIGPTMQKFTINENETVQDIADRINSDSWYKQMGTASVNKYTGLLEYTDKYTGEVSQIKVGREVPNPESPNPNKPGEYYTKFEETYPAVGNPNVSYNRGQDAILNVTVNGETMELKRSSNTVDLDGLKVTLKGTFGYDASGKLDPTTEAVTFTTQSDSDKIVDAVRSFVEDYNALITELHGAYSTMPLQDSKGNEYSPLTEEEAAKNTESYNKSYEEKAKTGLLFGDSDLATLYSKLTQAVQGSGEISQALRSIGLEVSYSGSNRLSTLTLDEDKLRDALDNDPDKVKSAFTQSTSSGASVNGLMAGVKSVLEQYGNTSIGSPGILVSKAGTEMSSYSLNHNELNDQINNLQEQIDKWTDKMGDKIDYYTNQFTRLELLINQMNSQSSMLSSLSGGY